MFGRSSEEICDRETSEKSEHPDPRQPSMGVLRNRNDDGVTSGTSGLTGPAPVFLRNRSTVSPSAELRISMNG